MIKLLRLLPISLLLFSNLLFSELNNQDDVFLEGYDVVAYYDNQALKGNLKFQTQYQGIKFYFANRVNLAKFKDNPDMFIPAYGGYCAYAMLDGEKVTVDPKTFQLKDGQVYLFYNAFFINTLQKWDNLAEQKGYQPLIKQANKAWDNLQSR